MHEFGRTRFDFYAEAIKRLGISHSDIVLDSGAGNGNDGLNIASTYNPRLTLLLEPLNEEETPEEFDNRYIHLAEQINDNNLENVVLLPSPKSNNHSPLPNSSIPEESVSYLLPIAGRAESLPLPDQSVDIQLMIHSAYHFDNLNTAFTEAARVMKPGGRGLAITNGPDDKSEFKRILKATEAELQSEFPGTVSSWLDYNVLARWLSNYFDDVTIISYRDAMVVTEAEFPIVRWAYDSYRHLFYPLIINDGRWVRARKKFLEEPVLSAIQQKGEWLDTIDIAAVYFAKPKSNLSER